MASNSFEASVDELAELLGSKDASRISAAKDAMHMWSEAVKTHAEKERALQRRLVYLTTRELSQSAAKSVRSASRATWSTFWVVVFAMIAWTAATFMAVLVYGTR